MAVYVDPLCDHGWRLGKSCHMFADTLDELHAMADKIGMKRSWFQDKRMPHYDLVASKRKLAVEYGAVDFPNHQRAAVKRHDLGFCKLDEDTIASIREKIEQGIY